MVAVAAAVDPWGFRPFTTARWALVGVVVAAAAVASAAAPRARLPRPVVLAGAGLLVCLAVATATALDPLSAVLGHGRRHLGLLGWVVSALAFVAGTRLTAGEVRRLLGRAGVVAAGITGVAALADLAGWDPAGSRFAGGRIGGLLGQPLYLGAVAVMLVPLAVGVAVDASAARGWRRAAAGAAVVCAIALVATQTRGAWLGAALAVAVAWPRLAPPARAWLVGSPADGARGPGAGRGGGGRALRRPRRRRARPRRGRWARPPSTTGSWPPA